MLDRKTCKRCRHIKPLTDYYIRAYGNAGKPYYDGTCKTCVLGKEPAPIGQVEVNGTCYIVRGTSETVRGRLYYVLEHPANGKRGMWFPDGQPCLSQLP